MSDVNFIKAGEGYPIILVHGLAASLHDWDDLVAVLVQFGCQTIALDLPGHGFSRKPQDLKDYSLDFFQTAFEEWVNQLGLNEPPILICHSIGAYLVIKYALQNTSKIRALVLVNPLISLKQFTFYLRLFYRERIFSPRVLKFVSNTPEFLFRFLFDLTDFCFRIIYGQKSAFPKGVRKRMAKDYKLVNPGAFLLPFSIEDMGSDLEKIKIPVLIIGGKNDQTLLSSSFADIAKRIPNAQISIIVGNHNPQHSNPSEFNELLLRFVQYFV